jgi:hypothetical protein
MQAPNYIFPSLANNTHIMRPMNEITHTFDHLSTQLTLVVLRVKVSKCKLWNPSNIFHRHSSRLHFGHKWLTHFRCASEFLEFCHAFFGWDFILRHGAYQWSSFLRRRPSWRAPKWRCETHLRVSQNQGCKNCDLAARSRLLTLEKGRGSSWELRD